MSRTAQARIRREGSPTGSTQRRAHDRLRPGSALALHPTAALNPGHVLQLQDAMGNRAVGRLAQHSWRGGEPALHAADESEATATVAIETAPSDADIEEDESQGPEEEQFTLAGEAPAESIADTVKLKGFNWPQTIETANPGRKSEFGLTTSVLAYEADITHNRALKQFFAKVTFKQRILWETATGTGPNDQVDIPNAQAGAITGLNNMEIAADLAPKPGDAYPGRPPRQNYWVQSQTEKHELFHVNEYKKAFNEQAKAHQSEIAAGDFRTKAEIKAHIDEVLAAVFADVQKGMALPGGEVRAYGADAKTYTDLADAIRRGNYAFPPLRQLYAEYGNAEGAQQLAILAEIERQWAAMNDTGREGEVPFVPLGILKNKLTALLPPPEVND